MNVRRRNNGLQLQRQKNAERVALFEGLNSDGTQARPAAVTLAAQADVAVTTTSPDDFDGAVVCARGLTCRLQRASVRGCLAREGEECRRKGAAHDVTMSSIRASTCSSRSSSGRCGTCCIKKISTKRAVTLVDAHAVDLERARETQGAAPKTRFDCSV